MEAAAEAVALAANTVAEAAMAEAVSEAAPGIVAAVQSHKIDEWTPLVIANLRAKFGNKTDQLLTLLQETESLISGGSILAACLGEDAKKQDTDIYVPVQHIPRFLKEMVRPDDEEPPIFPAETYKQYAASFYCKSFLRKNGIRRVYNFGGLGISEVDIMSVRNKRRPLAVVNNFDLTFCQVWFDGKDVYASHPDHIRTKTGKMQIDYCMTLLAGNRFLKRRVRKYIDRGFTIGFPDGFDTSDVFAEVLEKIGREPDDVARCTNPIGGPYSREYIRRDVITDFGKQWYNRVAMRFFLGVRDGVDADGVGDFLHIPLAKEVRNDQIKRIDKDGELRLRGIGGDGGLRNYGDVDMGRPLGIDRFRVDVLDGYDSDDMTPESLKDLAVADFSGAAEDKDLAYYRKCTNLAINAHVVWKPHESYDRRKPPTLGFLAIGGAGRASYVTRRNRDLIGLIENLSLRSGEDLFGGEGKIYDIHKHSIDSGVTSKSLETYLRGTMNGDDYEPECYNKASGCLQKLKTHEIKAIVSREFYTEFSKPRPVKAGLNLEVDGYNSALRNAKTFDEGWGNIYKSTMCPYCLKFEERGEGCAVMTHDNPKKLTHNFAPYCVEERKVNEIVQKYKAAGGQLTGGYVRLEWCVECGCPCVNHNHFNRDLTALIPNPSIPDPGHPGQMMIDYGSCPGGGRPEMLARMMAVRDVYRRRNLRDTKEERKSAALAANLAPENAALMARATALWQRALPGITWEEERRKVEVDARTAAAGTDVEKSRAGVAAVVEWKKTHPEPPRVSWNIPVPKSKHYNDAVYEGSQDDADFVDWLDGPEVAAAAPLAVADAAAAAPHAAQEWNLRAWNFLENYFFNIEDEAFRDEIEIIVMTVEEEGGFLPELDKRLIDALAKIQTADPMLVQPVHLMNRAFIINGPDFLAKLDPAIGYNFVPPAQGGGATKRSTYKRRKGLPRKKTRVTRRSSL